MASQQQAYVADLIEAVKRKRIRTDNRPPGIERPRAIYTNHGNKLEPEARFVQQNRLDVPFGASTFRETVDFNGYKRNITVRNPPLVDPDGDLLEDDGDMEDGYATPIEDNIYKDIRLEETLQPLLAASDLPTHPSLSYPYYERGLPEMIRVVEEALHKEQQTLWKMKEVFTALRGDATWAPVGNFQDTYDDFLLGGTRQTPGSVPASTVVQDYANGMDPPAGTGPALSASGGSIGVLEQSHTETGVPGVTMGEADGSGTHMALEIDESNGTLQATNESGAQEEQIEGNPDEATTKEANGASPNGTLEDVHLASVQGKTNGVSNGMDHEMKDVPGADTIPVGSALDEMDSQVPSHRMTTRAQANQTSDVRSRSASLSSSVNPVHPMFQFPVSAIADWNLGLPPQMGDDCRAMVLAYVTKQEEVVRQIRQLHNGLLRAMEMRRNVLKWSKADGHVGEMSDGEDWYDKEEWGLEVDLIKGKEEEEDDDRVGKKTRRAGRGEKN